MKEAAMRIAPRQGKEPSEDKAEFLHERADEPNSPGNSVVSGQSVEDMKAEADLVPAKKRSGRKKTYTEEEEELLVRLVTQFGEGNWAAIAAHMPGKNRKQLRERYMYFLKRGQRDEKFTEEEDNYIMETIRREGRMWSKMASALPGKNSLMIKNRYYSKLRKEMKKAASKSGESKRKRKAVVTAESTLQVIHTHTGLPVRSFLS